MKFNGKQLFELGVPQSKIKFLINKEFDSTEHVLEFLEQEKTKQPEKPNFLTVRDWIWNTFEHLPMAMHGDMPVKMSRSELKRVLDSGGVMVNNATPQADDNANEISFPLTNFVWFPKSKRRVTWY